MPKIIANEKINHGYYKIILYAPAIAQKARPGQFLNIRVHNSLDPLLRRPFGVHRVYGAKVEILYEVLGKGTEILSQRRAGEYLDVLGPLGNGFSAGGSQFSILVSGGMGVAPLVFLAQKIKRTNPLVLLGAQTKNRLLCEKEFKDFGCTVKVSTDDGSKGFKGKVSELLKKLLPLAISYKPLAIYACGPFPMLKEIAMISKKHNIPAQVSLEEHLACGIGACLGCVVKTKEGYQRVCKEGPVFKADKIIW